MIEIFMLYLGISSQNYLHDINFFNEIHLQA